MSLLPHACYAADDGTGASNATPQAAAPAMSDKAYRNMRSHLAVEVFKECAQEMALDPAIIDRLAEKLRAKMFTVNAYVLRPGPAQENAA